MDHISPVGAPSSWFWCSFNIPLLVFDHFLSGKTCTLRALNLETAISSIRALISVDEK